MLLRLLPSGARATAPAMRIWALAIGLPQTMALSRPSAPACTTPRSAPSTITSPPATSSEPGFTSPSTTTLPPYSPRKPARTLLGSTTVWLSRLDAMLTGARLAVGSAVTGCPVRTASRSGAVGRRRAGHRSGRARRTQSGDVAARRRHRAAHGVERVQTGFLVDLQRDLAGQQGGADASAPATDCGVSEASS